MKVKYMTVSQIKAICTKYRVEGQPCNEACPFKDDCILGVAGYIIVSPNMYDKNIDDSEIFDKDTTEAMSKDEGVEPKVKDESKKEYKHANLCEGNEAPNAEYNVYGSKLEDVREINRLKDENLSLKLIIGDMQLKIFTLSNELSKEKK